MSEDWNKFPWNEVDDLRAKSDDWGMWEDGRFFLRPVSYIGDHDLILASITAKAAAGDVFHQRALVEALRRRMTVVSSPRFRRAI